MKNNQIIDPKKIKLIKIFRKVHFVLFNLVILDVAYIGNRTLFHVKWVGEVAF
jgi:hypothetical protein